VKRLTKAKNHHKHFAYIWLQTFHGQVKASAARVSKGAYGFGLSARQKEELLVARFNSATYVSIVNGIVEF